VGAVSNNSSGVQPAATQGSRSRRLAARLTSISRREPSEQTVELWVIVIHLSGRICSDLSIDVWVVVCTCSFANNRCHLPLPQEIVFRVAHCSTPSPKISKVCNVPTATAVAQLQASLAPLLPHSLAPQQRPTNIYFYVLF
jgi:hypothetical protein